MRRLARGIYVDDRSIRVTYRAHGRQKEKRFPLDAPLETVKAWRTRTIGQLADVSTVETGRGSFVRDVVRFLKTRRSRASFKSDRAHLRPWVHRFKHRSRWAIAREDVQTAVSEWEAAGYSPKEIRHRVRILRQLFHALDGSHAATPCDDLSLPAIVKARPVSVTDALVRDVALELRRHEITRRLRNAKTRARYLVLATTGQRPAQLRRALPMDVHLDRRVWFVRPAKGDAGTIVYLNDDMIAAWTLFIAAQAWGSYDGRSFVKTLRRAGWPTGIRPYNLRHTVGLSLSELGVDLGDIQNMLGHSSPATTRIYVPAVLSRLKTASEKLDGRVSAAAVARPVPPAMKTRGRKAKQVEKTGQTATGTDARSNESE
jgi:site-specific recombinase XerD